jgi:hypothetical protein
MGRKMPGLLMLAVLGLILVPGIVGADTTNKAVQIYAEGKTAPYQGQVVEEYTMMPLLTAAEALCFTIEPNQGQSKISLKLNSKTVVCEKGKNMITCNGQEIFIPAVPQDINSVIYIPLRPVAENLGYKVKWDSLKQSVSLSKTAENPINIDTDGEKSEDATLILKIQYPKISGGANKTAEDRINTLLAKHAADFKDTWLKDYRENAQEVMSFHKFQYYIGTQYKITYNSKGKLGVLFEDYVYSGGAHGMTYRKSYLLDLSTGQEYGLKDLFRESAAYVTLVNQEVKRQMDESGLTPGLLSPFESIKPDQDFYLTEDGLVIYFQLYEYTPYALGFPEFQINYDKVKDALKLDF